jgi:hypothetical protein
MREQVIPILKKIWKVLRWVLLALLIVILLAILTVLFDKYGWSTGINSEIKTVGTDEVYRPTKTLWDWLDLLIVPLVLALGAIWFNIQTRKTERKLESERLAEAVLQSYLEKMTEFLLENQLGSSEPKSKLRVVARAHTLTALRGLDGTRKGILLKFLYETELIIPHTSPDPSQSKGTVIELFLADLSEANLIDAFLKGANLFRVDLKRANLSLSTLIDAHLDGARLEGADLRNANLIGAHLNYVNLSNADLRKADLTEAFITSRADLTRADLRGLCLREQN